MPHLNRLTNGQTTARHPLDQDVVTFGRRGENTVVLTDGLVSGLHAQIVKGDEGLALEDLDSRNGTFVNDVRITRKLLEDGDRIKIGSIDFVYNNKGPHHKQPLRQDDYMQSLILGRSELENQAPILPSLVIDDLGSTQQGSPDMSFVAAPPFEASQGLDSKFGGRTGDTTLDGVNKSKEHFAEIKLRLVQEVSEQLVRIFDPQELLDKIMSIVVEQTGADRGMLCLLDEDRKPVPIAAFGITPGEEVRFSRSVVNQLITKRTGVLIKPEERSMYQSLVGSDFQSTICAPLWTGDSIVGILSLDSLVSGFTQETLELLMAVAHPVAVGLERNRLSHQMDTERQLRDYMTKYIDHHILEQISQGQLEGNDPLMPHETELTILFSDIISFTKISESMSALELSEFMSRYLTSMTDAVFAHGGTIDKYIGDAVMALFGAPVASEDSAAAAIRAALEMKERIKEFKEPGGKKQSLRVRVGINTGTAVVGNLGSKRRSEYTALGDSVNVASRLETLARPNEICVDEDTYSKTKDEFVFEQIGAIDVKNRVEPVSVYKVIGLRGDK